MDVNEKIAARRRELGLESEKFGDAGKDTINFEVTKPLPEIEIDEHESTRTVDAKNEDFLNKAALNCFTNFDHAIFWGNICFGVYWFFDASLWLALFHIGGALGYRAFKISEYKQKVIVLEKRKNELNRLRTEAERYQTEMDEEVNKYKQESINRHQENIASYSGTTLFGLLSKEITEEDFQFYEKYSEKIYEDFPNELQAKIDFFVYSYFQRNWLNPLRLTDDLGALFGDFIHEIQLFTTQFGITLDDDNVDLMFDRMVWKFIFYVWSKPDLCKVAGVVGQ